LKSLLVKLYCSSSGSESNTSVTACPDLLSSVKSLEREMRLLFEEQKQQNRVYGRNLNARAIEMALKQAEREQIEKLELQRRRDEELRKIAGSRNSLHSTVSRLDQADGQTHQVHDANQEEIEKRIKPPHRIFNRARRIT
jgi:hypothetical protein